MLTGCLDNLSSLMEILVGFNFALVASNSFMRELSTKFTMNTENLRLHNTIKSLSNEFKKVLELNMQAYKENEKVSASFGQLLNEYEDFDKDRKAMYSRLDKDITQKGNGDRLQRFSLHGGIQGVVYLLIAGMCTSIKDGFVEFLIFFNFISLIVLYLWNFKFSWVTPSLRNTLWCQILLYTLVYGIWLVSEFALGIKINYDLSTVYSLSFLLVSGSHFLVFFVLAWSRHHRASESTFAEAIDLKRKIEELYVKLDGATMMISVLSIEAGNSSNETPE